MKPKSLDNIPDMPDFVKFSFELVGLSNDVSHSCDLCVCFSNTVDCAESVVRTCGYSFCLVLQLWYQVVNEKYKCHRVCYRTYNINAVLKVSQQCFKLSVQARKRISIK
jgi:hypothetical protein